MWVVHVVQVLCLSQLTSYDSSTGCRLCRLVPSNYYLNIVHII